MTDDEDVWGRWAWGGDLLASERVDRRTVLSAVGTAGAAAVAGCSEQSDEGTETGTTADEATTETMSTTQTTDEETDSTDETDSQPAIGSRFGHTVTSDETASVEADHTVDLEMQDVEGRPIPEFYFEPAGLYVEPGDTVQFNLTSPHHNVNAYHPGFGYEQRVPDGVPPFSSPMLVLDDAWYYTFDTEGVHDYVCAPHEIYGMAGRIVVGSATGPGANAVGEGQGRAPSQTAGTVLDADAMAPDNIVDEGSISWSDIADENKELQM